MKGIFITFEGPEGCGKTTQSKLLYNYLRRAGYDCIHTREPGGTKAGELIRKVLLKTRAAKISDMAEVFLFEACRAQIIKEIIKPALAKKKIIICDRFSDATVAYQGYGGKIPIKTIDMLNHTATGGLKPSLTVLLDIDTITGLRRAKKKGTDRMEAKDLAYHRRVRSGYLALAKKEPRRIKIVRVMKHINDTQKEVRRIALDVISRYKRTR